MARPTGKDPLTSRVLIGITPGKPLHHELLKLKTDDISWAAVVQKLVDGQYRPESDNVLSSAIRGSINDNQLMDDIIVLIENGTDLRELILSAVGKEVRQRIKGNG